MNSFCRVFCAFIVGLYCAWSQHERLTQPRPYQAQSAEEANYLKYHKCKNAGEAYGAAYLITKEHIVNHNTNYNLTWVNCEMASFIMMHQNADVNKRVNGTIIQSLDVLDFSVIHLSAYERLQRRYTMLLQKIPYSDPPTIEVISNVTNTLKMQYDASVSLPRHRIPEFRRTIAVMPFLGTGMGAGHSILSNRYAYLKACFWSIYVDIPNIAVAVVSEEDAHYARHTSGLPFYDVILLPNLPKLAGLPVGTVQAAKERFIDGRWDFDYMYFTESDQILLFRSPEYAYDILKKNPRYIIVPHRLMPYPDLIASHRHKKIIPHREDVINGWRELSCCLPRQNCVNRTTWVSATDPSVEIVKIFGLSSLLGNSNFHAESYRSCKLSKKVDICP